MRKTHNHGKEKQKTAERNKIWPDQTTAPDLPFALT
jgi:hypothetical protein